MAVIDQMLGCDLARLHVVERDRVSVQSTREPVDSDDGDADRDGGCERRRVRQCRNADDAIDSSAEEQLDGVDAGWGPILLIGSHQHADAVSAQILLDSDDDLEVEGILKRRQQNADGSGDAAPQAAGERVRPVVQFRSRRLDRFPVRGKNVSPVVVLRDRRQRQARQPLDVLVRCGRSSAFRQFRSFVSRVSPPFALINDVARSLPTIRRPLVVSLCRETKITYQAGRHVAIRRVIPRREQ